MKHPQTTDDQPGTDQKVALAIHTASPDLGLAIGTGVSSSRVQVWENLGRDLSTRFHAYLAEFIAPHTWNELAFIAVVRGPGGFTGTRLGVVAARTLAQQLEIPLFAISTLAAVAWNTSSSHLASNAFPTPELAVPDIAVQMPAQRGEFHTAIYSIQRQNSQTLEIPIEATIAPEHRSKLAPPDPILINKHPDTVLAQAEWLTMLEEWESPYHLVQAEGGLGHTVASVLDLAYLEWQRSMRPHWSEALPVYGQSPV
ncbi:tRNA (adenosine(37)-N6)-threonylcarbamoyltransferase complex dimerization subunit type 1 TsaB [Egbenema bharatensis]|uniref:tRNA (adenosine(37)-N6)-threonylcarbamoyltransferase complex dimerization subunit type 1 TsaB n=1 Tax=Egbenema bharatensis TaxID=3463334 RepID=UPI003A865926